MDSLAFTIELRIIMTMAHDGMMYYDIEEKKKRESMKKGVTVKMGEGPSGKEEKKLGKTIDEMVRELTRRKKELEEDISHKTRASFHCLGFMK